MKRSALSIAILLSLGLTACGGGGGDSSSTDPVGDYTPAPGTDPAPITPADACTNIDGVQDAVPPGHTASGGTCTLIDACLNYDGDQTLDQVANAYMVRSETDGVCRMVHNHDAMAFVGADWARMAGFQGQGQTIAIVDTGTRTTHQELYPRVIGGWNYVDGNDQIEAASGAGTLGSDPHGLYVSGAAMGKDLGLAPQAQVFHAASNVSASTLAIASKDVMNGRGIKVVNHSNTWGADMMYYNTSNDPHDILSPVDGLNGLLVFGAGNFQDDHSALFDTALNSQPGLESALSYDWLKDNVIYVTSYNLEQKGLTFSSYPGWRPEFYQRFITVSADDLTLPGDASDSELVEHQAGTSFAAPQISAAVAILMGVNPALSAPQAAQILLDTARRDLPEYGQDCTYTTDTGSHSVSCGHMKFGMGVMDLKAAIQQAQGL